MRKLWIIPALFVTALMASAAYGGSVTVAPVTQVTVSPHLTVNNQVSNQVGTQVAVGVVTQAQTATAIALHGNASATTNANATNMAITKSIITFGHSSAIGQ